MKNGARRNKFAIASSFYAAISGFARSAIDAGGFFARLSGHL
jgi:hypothetical protein